MTFTEDETEIMAEMEHTLWNVERLRDGPLVYTMVHELYFKGDEEIMPIYYELVSSKTDRQLE